jgi:iduronate 2-sulfatase
MRLLRFAERFVFPWALAVALVGATARPGIVGAAEPAKRPNVLFFAVDDLRTDLGCYGHPEAKTPHIDALARRGMVFRRAYCQQAVCSPSRTSLLTGLRPDSTKVYDLITHFRDTVPDVVSLPQHFREQGYYTVGMGKIYHGGYDDPKSWSEPHRNGTGEGYVLPENKARLAEGKAREKAAKSTKKKKTAGGPARGEPYEMADVPDEAYHDGSLAQMAVDKLRELKGKEQPFFLAVGFLKPHLPFNSPKKYWDLYDPVQLKLAANPFRPKDAPPYAVTDFGELRNYFGVPQSGPISDEMARKLIHAYRAASSFTDANVGKVLAELDKLGLAENTIVVLWGDHGYHLGDHGMWTKHTNYEQACRIALLVVAPGVTQPRTSTSALVESVDLFPTLCELAGLPPPPGPQPIDGQSLVPVLNVPSQSHRDHAYHCYPRGERLGRAIRTARHRLVEWKRPGADPATAVLELYDYQLDPDETKNLAAAQRETVAELRAMLAKHGEAVALEAARGNGKKK